MTLLQNILSPFNRKKNNGFVPARECTSSDGIPYVLQPTEADRVVAIAFAFVGGYLDDLAMDPPVALIAPAAMLHQAFHNAASPVGERLSDIGAGISLFPQPLALHGQFSAPLASVQEAARLGRSLFSGAEFAEPALTAGVDTARNVIREATGDSRTRLTNVMLSEAIAPGPQFSPDKVTEADLGTVSTADLDAWRYRHLVRSRLRIAIVGPVTEHAAGALVDELFALLPLGAAAPDRPSVFRTEATAREVRVGDNSDGPVGLLLASAEPHAGTIEDYLAANMFAQILAGDDRSRLFRLVRDQAAASYGLDCQAEVDGDSVVFSVFGRLHQSGFEELLTKIRSTIADLASNGPTQEETKHARARLRQYYQTLTLQNSPASVRLNEMLCAGWSVEAINRIGTTIEDLDLTGARFLLEPLATRPIVVVDR